jgi:hypothetical protein
MDKNNSIDQRIDGYVKLMDFVSGVRKKFTVL